MSEYFKELVGQSTLKRKLSFFIEAFEKTKRLPFLLFTGQRGTGKTEFARHVAKELRNEDNSKRPVLEINSSILRNNRIFFENIYLAYISRGQPITLIWDEFHNCPNDLAQALLTICNTDKNPVRHFQYNDSILDFDFTRLSFLFCTTEPDKIFPPLKDRFDVVDFENYTGEDLKKIVCLNADKISFLGSILDEIVQYVRGNARSCVKMAENIITYCAKMKTNFFGFKEWNELKKALSILPYGLTSSEAMILRELDVRGPCSLNMLASATGLSRSAIQSDIERHLLKLNFVKIDGKRMITQQGQKILKQIG